MTDVTRFVTPVALIDVIKMIAPEFERSTGYRLELSIMLNPEVPTYILDGAPWSLAASNPWHLEEIEIGKRGPILPLGRSPLAFGALGQGRKAATDEAEISKLLHRSKRIGVTGAGTSGETFARLLDRLDLTEEMRNRVIPLQGGEPMRKLLAGELDLAALPLTNVAPIPGVRAAAICPWDMEVHIDLALCLHPEACTGSHAFVAWLVSTARDATLSALGLLRA